jgi:hypothetical protein
MLKKFSIHIRLFTSCLILGLLFATQPASSDVIYRSNPSVTFTWPAATDSPEFYNVYVSDNGSKYIFAGTTPVNLYQRIAKDQHTYQIKVQAVDSRRGVSPLSEASLPSTIMLTPPSPEKKNVLLPNYPNPFNPETWIPYRLSDSAEVTFTIYNITGELIRTLNLGYQSAGNYTNRTSAAYWDGRTQAGEIAASGIYYYTIRTSSGFTDTRKMVVVK